MHFQLLSLIVEELAAVLSGARLERVFQAGDGNFYFSLRKEGREHLLLLSPDRSQPRLHLASAKLVSVASPHPFVLNLRSRLIGARMNNVCLLNEDRVAEMRLAKSGKEFRLIFEVTGPSANIILTDGSSAILAVYHQVPLQQHAQRTLLPGAQYVLPLKPVQTKKNDQVNIDGLAQPKSGPGKHQHDKAVSPNASAEAFYTDLVSKRASVALRNEISSSLAKALKRNERKRDALSSDLQSAEHAEEYKQAGNIILANLQRLTTGMKDVELEGYDGIVVSVRLDPKRSPSKNAELYFKKYKKAKAGQKIIATRLQDATEEMIYLKSLAESVGNRDSLYELDEIRLELLDQGYLKRKPSRTTAEPPLKKISGFRKIVFQGWEILVGSSASGNDYLTTKLARPDDLWLHAEGLPGSHVLIRNIKKEDVPVEVIAKAASLAAHYSKGRNALKVPVTYTQARHVKKPKGAKPGLVTLTERKTVVVRPDDGLS